MNRDTTPPRQTLEEIIDTLRDSIVGKAVSNTIRGGNVKDSAKISAQAEYEAIAAIQEAIEDAKPEKYPDPTKAFNNDVIDYHTFCNQQSFNAAIDQYDANLRQRGLMR